MLRKLAHRVRNWSAEGSDRAPSEVVEYRLCYRAHRAEGGWNVVEKYLPDEGYPSRSGFPNDRDPPPGWYGLFPVDGNNQLMPAEWTQSVERDEQPHPDAEKQPEEGDGMEEPPQWLAGEGVEVMIDQKDETEDESENPLFDDSGIKPLFSDENEGGT